VVLVASSSYSSYQTELDEFEYEANHGNIDIYVNQFLKQLTKSLEALDPIKKQLKEIKGVSDSIKMQVIQGKNSDIKLKAKNMDKLVSEIEMKAEILERQLFLLLNSWLPFFTSPPDDAIIN